MGPLWSNVHLAPSCVKTPSQHLDAGRSGSRAVLGRLSRHEPKDASARGSCGLWRQRRGCGAWRWWRCGAWRRWRRWRRARGRGLASRGELGVADEAHGLEGGALRHGAAWGDGRGAVWEREHGAHGVERIEGAGHVGGVAGVEAHSEASALHGGADDGFDVRGQGWAQEEMRGVGHGGCSWLGGRRALRSPRLGGRRRRPTREGWVEGGE